MGFAAAYFSAMYSYGALADEVSKLRAQLDAARAEYLSLKSRYGNLLAQYRGLRQNYDDLRASYGRLKRDYEGVKAEYARLRRLYGELREKYAGLQSSYQKLSCSYAELSKKYSELRSAYDQLLQVNQRLERKVREYLYTSSMRTGGPRATALFQPNDPEIVRLVGAITGGYDGTALDMYGDFKRLYMWVVKHIRYCRDPAYTAVTGLCYRVIGGERVLYDFTVAKVGDYWRYAVETLREGRGDCEDQAILLASMVRAYFLHYVGRNYRCYVLALGFESGVGHALVVIPVKGQQVVILDPAGHYYTNSMGVVVSKSVWTEFRNYERAWRTRIKTYYFLVSDSGYIYVRGGLGKLVECLYG